MSDGLVVSVDLADVRLIVIGGRPVKTGIFKLPAEGRVPAGHGVTVETLGQIAFGDRDLVGRALEAPALGEKWRHWLEGRRKRRPA